MRVLSYGSDVPNRIVSVCPTCKTTFETVLSDTTEKKVGNVPCRVFACPGCHAEVVVEKLSRDKSNADAISELKFLKEKLFNGIFSDKIWALDVAIAALQEKNQTTST